MAGTEFVEIDGSLGEGGGQIVRSALALSLVTGQPIAISKIRAGRQKPGLMRQHLTAVNAATRVGNAQVTGAEIGARSLTFAPQSITPGEYHFSIGTAGSTTLVLQTILPALLIANGPSRVILEGGTHNPWAPPFDFLQQAFLPLVNRMGPTVTAQLERHGFHPAGGGRFVVTIEPTPVLKSFDLLERGGIVSRSATGIAAHLQLNIPQREVRTLLNKMNWQPECGTIIDAHEARCPGNLVYATLQHEHVTEVFTGFGRLGASAETVANEVVQEIRHYLRTDAPVGPYLADQLLLPFGISAWQHRTHATRGGSFRTAALTRHATTHIEILQKLLGLKIQVTQDPETNTHTVSFQ